MARSIGIMLLGAAGVALLGGLPLLAAAPETTALALDGTVAPVRSVTVEGGTSLGKAGSKDLGLEFEFAATSAPMMRWLVESTDQRAGAKSGVVYWLTAKNEVAASRAFASAKVTRIAFPGLDASSAAPLYVRMKADATPSRAPTVPDAVSSPRLKASKVDDYALRLGGLPCDRIYSVSPIVWEGGRWSDIRLAIGMADHTPWNAWLQAYLEGEGEPVQGELTLLKPDLKTAVARFDLKDVSMLSLNVLSGQDPPQFEVKLRAKGIAVR